MDAKMVSEHLRLTIETYLSRIQELGTMFSAEGKQPLYSVGEELKIGLD